MISMLHRFSLVAWLLYYSLEVGFPFGVYSPRLLHSVIGKNFLIHLTDTNDQLSSVTLGRDSIIGQNVRLKWTDTQYMADDNSDDVFYTGTFNW